MCFHAYFGIIYIWLCKLSPSPISELNKVMVLMQIDGAEKALIREENIEKQNTGITDL
jgi:hypothetical protein